MAKKVIGIQKNVTFKIDGNDWCGISLFLSEERENVVGVATEKIFVGSTKPCFDIANKLNLGDMVQTYFNRFGKIADIVPVK